MRQTQNRTPPGPPTSSALTIGDGDLVSCQVVTTPNDSIAASLATSELRHVPGSAARRGEGCGHPCDASDSLSLHSTLCSTPASELELVRARFAACLTIERPSLLMLTRFFVRTQPAAPTEATVNALGVSNRRIVGKHASFQGIVISEPRLIRSRDSARTESRSIIIPLS